MTEEMIRAARDFVASFEAVFGDDWQYTKEMLGIQDEYESHEQAVACRALGLETISIISEGGTFLEPGVEDETEDWGNRGALLQRYRQLKRLLQESDMGEV
jgi:hypothetical protein